MIDYSIIKEDEYELVFDSESEASDIEVNYSYDLNVNYFDYNSVDSGDSDYDSQNFFVCMNFMSPLDYSQQAHQYEQKAKEALTKRDISKYTFFMVKSIKSTSKISSMNNKGKEKVLQKKSKK